MITTSLYGDSTCTNELEIKGFRYSVVTLGMSTVIFQISTQIYYLLGPPWIEKTFANMQLKNNLQSFFSSASHTTATNIEAARSYMLLEGPGTGLDNPAFIWTRY